MSKLTARQLRDRLNTIPEAQLDEPVSVLWTDSDQTGYANDVEIEPISNLVEIIV